MSDWYPAGMEDDMRPRMFEAAGRGRPFALVTIVAAEGGGPRGVGAQMVVTADDMGGFLSGGCIAKTAFDIATMPVKAASSMGERKAGGGAGAGVVRAGRGWCNAASKASSRAFASDHAASASVVLSG